MIVTTWKDKVYEFVLYLVPVPNPNLPDLHSNRGDSTTPVNPTFSNPIYIQSRSRRRTCLHTVPRRSSVVLGRFRAGTLDPSPSPLLSPVGPFQFQSEPNQIRQSPTSSKKNGKVITGIRFPEQRTRSLLWFHIVHVLRNSRRGPTPYFT